MKTLEISYVTGSGQKIHRHRPEQFATRALKRDIRSVRLPVSYKNQSHLPGYFWMSRMKTLVAYESRLEMTILLQLDFNKTIVHVVSQPFLLHYGVDSKIYRHTPDYLAIYKNGAAEVINVKPRQFVNREKNRHAFAACEKAAIEMGWAYSTRCEIDPLYLANLRWLGGFRRPPTSLSEYSYKIIKAVAANEISISDLVKTMPTSPAFVRPVIFHLLWTGAFEANLYERLSNQTTIYLSAAGRASWALHQS